MENFWKWLNGSPIASFFRVALAVVLFQAGNDFAKTGHFDFSNWETWLIVAFVSAIPPVLRWLNPEDKSFGMK